MPGTVNALGFWGAKEMRWVCVCGCFLAEGRSQCGRSGRKVEVECARRFPESPVKAGRLVLPFCTPLYGPMTHFHMRLSGFFPVVMKRRLNKTTGTFLGRLANCWSRTPLPNNEGQVIRLLFLCSYESRPTFGWASIAAIWPFDPISPSEKARMSSLIGLSSWYTS